MEKIHTTSRPISSWHSADRPREKMLQHGAGHLSASELLAILINNGTPSRSALDLGRDLLEQCDNRLSQLARMSLHDLQRIKGIGPAKAVRIKAALELAVWLQQESLDMRQKLLTPKDAIPFLRQKLAFADREHFVVIYLDKANKVLHYETVSKGGISATIADPRLILRRGLELGATYLILSHNHPSGNLRPSESDRQLTHKLKEAALLMDMKIIDHLIVSEEGYYSFAEDGAL